MADAKLAELIGETGPQRRRPAYENAIVVEALAKRYANGTEAVRGISFRVRAGEIFGILGPNGAGKSTTMGMLGHARRARRRDGRRSPATTSCRHARGASGGDRLRDAGGRRRRARHGPRAARAARPSARALAPRGGAARARRCSSWSGSPRRPGRGWPSTRAG